MTDAIPTRFQYKAVVRELPLKQAGYADYSADGRLDCHFRGRLQFRTVDHFLFADAS
jgi:hypothetical protein